MEVWLGWLGAGVGLAGCVATYLMSSARARGPADTAGLRNPLLIAGSILLVSVVPWLIAMQTRSPFSPGQRLGWGYLIGGVSGAVASLLSYRLGSLESEEHAGSSARLSPFSLAFFALFSASLTYSLFRGDPQNALMGFSIGLVMAATVHYYSQRPEPGWSSALMEVWAFLGLIISSAIILAIAHFDRTVLRGWWALPILLATTVLVAGYVGTELGFPGGSAGRSRVQRLVSGALPAALVIILSAIYAQSVLHSCEFFGVVVVGIVVAAVVAWLAGRLENGDVPGGIEAASASVLLVVAFVVAAFKLWAGLGIALGLLSALAVALPVLGASARPQVSRGLRGALALGIAVLLFRLFIEQYRSDLGRADLRIHYTFIGAMLGAIVPFMFISSTLRNLAADKDDAARLQMAYVGAMGLIAAGSPLLLFLIWGPKVVLGYLFGLTASIAFLLLISLPELPEAARFGRFSPVFLVIGAELVAIQFLTPLISLELTRDVRALILLAVVLLAVVWAVLTGILSRRGTIREG